MVNYSQQIIDGELISGIPEQYHHLTYIFVKRLNKKGRPRPQYTVILDNRVLRFLVLQGKRGKYTWTVAEIAEIFCIPTKKIYASLLRLMYGDGNKRLPKNSRVTKVNRTEYCASVFVFMHKVEIGNNE